MRLLKMKTVEFSEAMTEGNTGFGLPMTEIFVNARGILVPLLRMLRMQM